MRAKLLIAFLVILGLTPIDMLAQDIPATVYFYRPGRLGGAIVGYNLRQDGEVVGRIKDYSVLVLHPSPGAHLYKAETEDESSIRLTIEPGKSYFVECGISTGIIVGRPVFRIVSKAEAKRQIAAIDASVANTILLDSQEVNHAIDTASALHNLFQRKRKGGNTRAIIFGILTVGGIINLANSSPSYAIINQGSAGSQKILLDSGPPVGSYFLVGFTAFMTISGGIQAGNHNQEELDKLMADYGNGKGLPLKIKQKLRPRDFK